MQKDNLESEDVLDDDAELDMEAVALSEMRKTSLNLAEENTTPEEEIKEMRYDTGEIEESPSAIIEISTSQAEPEETYPMFTNEDDLSTAENEVVPSVTKFEEEFGKEAYGDEFTNGEEAQPVYTEGFTAQSKEEFELDILNVLDAEAQQQGDIGDEQPTHADKQSTAQQVTITEPVAVTKMKAENYCIRESFWIRPAEVMYKGAARVIQDATIPLHLRQCSAYIPGTSVRGAQGGSNRQVAEMMRNELLEYRRACNTKWQPNPACTVPMRAKRYVRKSKMRAAAPLEEWRIWEERDKDRRDYELAVELGYETLVGNLLYIDIPGGNDINRSWQNFLSEDVMEWGFPYEKGSIERPRMKQPEPYLAHQVKEKLWKFPKSRTFQAAQEE